MDALMTKDESRALATWVAATGKKVTVIFVTHAHGDHFFGAPAVRLSRVSWNFRWRSPA